MLPRILIIAGSDSSGGAGIQADIKTVTMRGGYAMTAITALTAQNTQSVQAVHAVPAAFVAQQIHSCIEDIGVDAIKLGMLLNADIIEAVADSLACLLPASPVDAGSSGQRRSIPVILDPVMVATSGAALLENEAVSALRTRLFPLASLITPNIPEAEWLTGMTIDTREEMEQAAVTIAAAGPAILLKGGHRAGTRVEDLLLQDGRSQWFESDRLDSAHTHGTGCTLASAIATELGHGRPLKEAISAARAYVHTAIASAPGFGQGCGPLNHLHLRNP